MNEAKRNTWKRVCLGLLAANLVLLIYTAAVARSERAVASRISALQMNAENISIVHAPAREKRSPVSAQGATARPQACLEWGPIARVALPQAQAELARLALAEPPIALALEGNAGAFAYYVREPDHATVARFTDLQRAFPGSAIRAARCP